MKKLLYLFFWVSIAFSSCKRHDKIETFPLDMLYILEYNYTSPESYEKPEFKFDVIGFCELDGDFNLRYARQLLYDNRYYYNSQEMVPDSMRNKISNIILKYRNDTTFLYHGTDRTYGGNFYRFIMQKQDRKDVTIKFEPEFLPEDLKFVYSLLYLGREKIEYNRIYNNLFEMFKNQVQDDELPPPVLPAITFTLPIEKK